MVPKFSEDNTHINVTYSCHCSSKGLCTSRQMIQEMSRNQLHGTNLELKSILNLSVSNFSFSTRHMFDIRDFIYNVTELDDVLCESNLLMNPIDHLSASDIYSVGMYQLLKHEVKGHIFSLFQRHMRLLVIDVS